MTSDQLPAGAMPADEQLPLLILPEGWDGFSSAAIEAPLIAAVLPGFLRRQRWFAGKSLAFDRVAISWQAIVAGEPRCLWLGVSVIDDAEQSYSLPLALSWERDECATIDTALIVARVSQGGRRGMLYDAFAAPAFCQRLLDAMNAQATLAANCGGLKFSSTPRLAPALAAPLQRISAASSNTTLALGDRLLLKAYRRLRQGINVEHEIGRFLCDVSAYRHCAAPAGAIEYEDSRGTTTPLVLVQEFVANQGDAWQLTIDYLARFLAECGNCGNCGESLERAAGTMPDDRHRAQLRQMTRLGQRTGELHRALATATGDAHFDAQPISAEQLRAWARQAGAEAAQTLALLQSRLPGWPSELRAMAQALLAAPPAAALDPSSLAAAAGATMTRVHGDFHLGQVLVAGDDFIIIDFEGEPGRTLQQRRQKQSPWRDVAGLLRSLSYAAHSALREAVAAQPAIASRLEAAASDWEARARAAFLAGYREAAPRQDERVEARLLAFFLIEKAFYELRYELDNRPDWVAVPLAGLLDLLRADPR